MSKKIDYFVVLLALISILVCLTNYTPNTFLSGWDTLHPEFNLSQYWGRITSVWQPHQGLGAPPSQSHASEIPRMSIIALFTTLFSLSFVRYAYVFLMIILGPIGIYLFIVYIFSREEHSYNHDVFIRISAFIGALFYLLNVGTVQHFIAPLEMFVTKFGYIGFLFLFSTRFIDKGSKKDIVLYSITSLLSASMAHTATLWYVYFLGFLSYVVILALIQRKNIKRTVVIIFVTLALNLFWILPNVYYSIHYGSDVINSKIHRLSSEETYYYNKKYGTLANFLLLKNFLFDWRVELPNQDFVKLLKDWETHLQLPFISGIAYFFSLSGVIGILFTILKRKRHPYNVALIPLFVGTAFFLLSNIPFFSLIFDWMRSQNGLIKEALRSPFTKFSLYLIFTLSIFIAYAQYILLKFLEKVQNALRSPHLIDIYSAACILGIFIYAIPAFQGQYISPIERVSIPSEYFSLFDWSQKQTDGRMLMLPINDMFGWVYYKWEVDGKPQVYQGAGFTWFGIKQPTLNREFDRWYPYNEQNYREISYAVYSKNASLFKSLLNKYNIKYILLDENVFIPNDSMGDKKLYYSQLKDIISQIPSIQLSARFGDKISVYSYTSPNTNVLLNIPSIGPTYQANYVDQAYLDHGNYVTMLDGNNQFVYPERNILTNRERVNQSLLTITKDSYSVLLQRQNEQIGKINLPNIADYEREFSVDVYASSYMNKPKLRIKYIIPSIQNYDYSQQIVYLPQKNVSYLALDDKYLVLPDNLSEREEIYIGEFVLEYGKKNAIYYSNNGSLEHVYLELPQIALNLGDVSQAIQVKGNFPKAQINPDISSIVSELHDCNYKKSEYINKEQIFLSGDEYALRYTARNGTVCDHLAFPNLSHNVGYVLAIESKNSSGLPIKICVEDYELKKCIYEDELSLFKNYQTDYFIIPPYKDNLSGYKLVLSNFGIGTIPTENSIKNISIIPFPYTYFSGLNWEQTPQREVTQTVTNDQAFEQNWTAYLISPDQKNMPHFLYPLVGTKLTNHVLVNNWENGWIMNESESINKVVVFYFIPDYLLIGGVGAAIIVLFIIFIRKKINTHG